MMDTESAVFTPLAKQNRHYHKVATEIYLLLGGVMTVESESVDYRFAPSNMIVVNPRTCHHAKQHGAFLCCVITVDYMGK